MEPVLRMMRFFFLVSMFLNYIASTAAGNNNALNRNCTSSEKASVCVLTFNGGELDPSIYPEMDGWLQNNVSVPTTAKQLSICFHIYLLRIYKKENTIILSIENDWALLIKNEILTLYEAATLEIIEVPFGKYLRKWTHLCVLVGSKLGLIVDGEEFLSKKHNMTVFTTLQGILRIVLGVNREYVSSNQVAPGSFRFTMPRIIQRELAKEEIQAMRSCSIGKWTSDDVSSNDWRLNYYSTGAGINSSKISIPISNELLYAERTCINSQNTPSSNFSVCNISNTANSKLVGTQIENILKICSERPANKLYFTPGAFNFAESAVICRSLQGSLISPDDKEMKTEIINPKNHLLNSYAFMNSSDPNSESSHCLTMLVGMTNITLGYWSCDDTMGTTAICKVPYSASLRLRAVSSSQSSSFVLDINNQENFFLSREDDADFVFVSFAGSRIYRRGDDFLFNQSTGTQLVLNLQNSALGSKVWSVKSTNNSQDNLNPNTFTYVLTGCKQGEFTCDSGQCINLTNHCDGFVDCGDSDSSDEVCKILLNDLDADSLQIKSPPAKETKLKITVTMMQVTNIDENLNVIEMNLKLTTIWKDKRLTFSQLRDKDNSLPADKYWTPKFNLSNIIFKDQIDYRNGAKSIKNTFAIVETNVSSVVAAKDAKEAYFYNGELESSLMQIEELTANFFCPFELSLFPFDVHVCNINISIINSGSFNTYISPKDLVTQSEEMVLTMFKASRLFIDKIQMLRDKPTAITIKIVLSRRFASYFFTTFLPCYFIICLSNKTHLFEISDFSNRIMVNLSCLIVLASLYAQLSTTLPASPVPKALEVFFFYCIAKSSWTFACLTFIERKRLSLLNREQDEPNPLDYRPVSKVFPFQMFEQPSSVQCPVSNKTIATIDRFWFCFDVVVDWIFIAIFAGYIYYARSAA